MLDYILWLKSSDIIFLVVTSGRATLHMVYVIYLYTCIFVLRRRVSKSYSMSVCGEEATVFRQAYFKKHPGDWYGFLEEAPSV